MSIVSPKMWDDRHFVSMTSEGKLLWLYLLTGTSGGVPGLIKGGVGAYADALHWDYPMAESALAELVNNSMIQFDKDARMICIPNAPKYSPCSNANVIKGWYRRWGDLAESPLKYSHIESIRAAFSDRDWFDEVWSATFGQIKIPEPSKQVPLFQQSSFPEPKMEKSNDSSAGETNTKPFPNGSANGLANKSVADITITTNRNYKPQTETETSNRNPPGEAFALAMLLGRCIADRQPKSKAAANIEKHAKSWSLDIDKINRLDGRSWEDIRKVLEWSQRDHFWSGNIKSGSKLRKQFDTLEGQMLRDGKPNGARGAKGHARKGAGLSTDDLIRMAREAEEREA